jgi:SP family arabinose:H+ symporter-like MFS transporter
MFQADLKGVLLLVGILVFISAFAMALCPIPWILCSEIFPTKVRGRAMSIATFTIWTSCYIVAKTFPILNDSPSIGPAVTFWVYTAFSAGALIFVMLMLPETKGRSLEEIERSWRREF